MYQSQHCNHQNRATELHKVQDPMISSNVGETYPGIIDMNHSFLRAASFLMSIKNNLSETNIELKPNTENLMIGKIHVLMDPTNPQSLVHGSIELIPYDDSIRDRLTANFKKDVMKRLVKRCCNVNEIRNDDSKSEQNVQESESNITCTGMDHHNVENLLMFVYEGKRFLIRSIETPRYKVIVDQNILQFSVKGIDNLLHATDSGSRSHRSWYLLREFDFTWTERHGCVMKFTHQLMNPTENQSKQHIIRTRYHSNCSRGWFLTKDELNEKSGNWEFKKNTGCHNMHKHMLLTYIRYSLTEPETPLSPVPKAPGSLESLIPETKILRSDALNDISDSILEIQGIITSLPNTTDLAVKYMWDESVTKCEVTTCATIRNRSDPPVYYTTKSDTLTQLFKRSMSHLVWNDYEPLLSTGIVSFVTGSLVQYPDEKN